MRGRRVVSRHVGAVLLLGACAASACDPGDGSDGGIDRSDFVAAYVDLRQAVLRDSVDEARRDSILAVHGVTADEMRDYIERHADDPAALADTWREVIDNTAARDSAAAARDSAAAAPDPASATPATP